MTNSYRKSLNAIPEAHAIARRRVIHQTLGRRSIGKKNDARCRQAGDRYPKRIHITAEGAVIFHQVPGLIDADAYMRGVPVLAVRQRNVSYRIVEVDETEGAILV